MRAGNLTMGLAFSAALAGCVVEPTNYSYDDAIQAPEQYDAAEQITESPPPLPVYAQPPCPEPGYLWTPGLWQWGPSGYFWVPGTWVQPPETGLLWTPGYWGMNGAAYEFHAGYWGPHVGFYGGINYGFGYNGDDYVGGRWNHEAFEYNTAVTNVNVNIVHNVYNRTIINNFGGQPGDINRVSYAGGPGTRLRPNPNELGAAREGHIPPTSEQVQHDIIARSQPDLAAWKNQGRPLIAATARAREFSGSQVVSAQSVGPIYHPASAPVAINSRYNPIVHARDLPTRQTAGIWGAGGGQQEQNYARQRNDLFARQEQERQTLAQRQQMEHENFMGQPMHDHQMYETMERQHWQQTSMLGQRHQQEVQQFTRSAPVHFAPTRSR